MDPRGIPRHFVQRPKDLFPRDQDSREYTGRLFCGHGLFVKVSSDLLLRGRGRSYVLVCVCVGEGVLE